MAGATFATAWGQARVEGGHSIMSNRSKRGTGAHLSKKPARSLKATAAVIGGAGMILAAPGAALLADPPEAQAQGGLATLTTLFGASGLNGA